MGTLDQINTMACYASEENTSLRPQALLEIGKLARAALAAKEGKQLSDAWNDATYAEDLFLWLTIELRRCDSLFASVDAIPRMKFGNDML